MRPVIRVAQKIENGGVKKEQVEGLIDVFAYSSNEWCVLPSWKGFLFSREKEGPIEKQGHSGGMERHGILFFSSLFDTIITRRRVDDD